MYNCPILRFEMASLTQILLFGCVLSSGTFVKNKNLSTTNPGKTSRLTCECKIGITFTGDKLKTQMDENKLSADIIDQFQVGIMEDVVISAKEKGATCMFDKSTYMLTCCDTGNLEKSLLLDKMELTTSQKIWGHDISLKDFIFTLGILLFFTIITAWKFMLTINYLVATVPVGQSESIEMTQENGINCICDESSYLFTCCDSGSPGQYAPVNRKELTAYQRFWAHDIYSIDFVLLFISLFLVMSIVSRELIRAIKHPETLVPLGLDETTETSSDWVW